jgi:putative hydrolase of the HAD superfamily
MKQISNFIFNEFSKKDYWSKYTNCDLFLNDLKHTNKYKLGIISNFDERLFQILNNLNLTKYFHFICIPSNCNGSFKPNEEIFSQAFKLSGISNHSQMLHIGDDYELDFLGATKLGFKSLIIDHHTKNDLLDLKDKIKKIYS